MDNEEQKPAGSDHGVPDLLNRDIRLLEAYTTWVETVRKETNTPNWLPHYPDWVKSRLFWRIRSGKEPLEYPPPTCFSCPWYELIEIPEAHVSFDPVRTYDDGKNVAYVAQCRYEVIQKASMDGEENAATLGYGPYRFKAWNALVTTKGINKTFTDLKAHICLIGTVELKGYSM